MDLSNDMLIKLIIDNLSFRDTVNLCNTNSILRKRCQNLNIYDRILQRDAPFATLTNYDSFEQLKLIQRNFRTLYKFNPVNGTVEFSDNMYYINDVMHGAFSIPGLPPPKGTKIYIIGTIPEMYSEGDHFQVYTSKSEAMKYFRNDPSRIGLVIDIILETEFDYSEDKTLALNYIETHNNYNEFMVYTEVILP
jgi:hypothetical protein